MVVDHCRRLQSAPAGPMTSRPSSAAASPSPKSPSATPACPDHASVASNANSRHAPPLFLLAAVSYQSDELCHPVPSPGSMYSVSPVLGVAILACSATNTSWPANAGSAPRSTAARIVARHSFTQRSSDTSTPS